MGTLTWSLPGSTSKQDNGLVASGAALRNQFHALQLGMAADCPSQALSHLPAGLADGFTQQFLTTNHPYLRREHFAICLKEMFANFQNKPLVLQSSIRHYSSTSVVVLNEHCIASRCRINTPSKRFRKVLLSTNLKAPIVLVNVFIDKEWSSRSFQEIF